MKERFLFDPNAKNITIEINIGTPGLANTQIYRRGNGDETMKIAESDIDSAYVGETSIGDLTSLEKKSIAIQTIINFEEIDKKLWPQLMKTISSTYILRDNLGNQKNYTHDVDDIIVSNDGKTVFIIKLIIFQIKTIANNLN